MKNRYFDLEMAKQWGERQAEGDGMTSLPINLHAIATMKGRNIIVEPSGDTGPGVSAMLLRSGNNFGIFYSTAIANIGFQRFSIAHELGHYFLEGHIDQIPFDEGGFHSSKAGFFSTDIYEKQADSFASGLLMPSRLFRRALNQHEDGLAGVKALAGLCETSLTATAIRYAELTEAASAVIVSTGQIVNFACLSSAMKDYSDIIWLRPGDPLPRNTLTANFNAEHNLFNENELVDETDLRLWLTGTRSREVTEEIIGLGAYGKTLTIVTCMDTAADGEDEEEEDALIDSWTPRFR